MRMAVAQSIISHELCASIFRSYYLPRSHAERELIDDLLQKISSTNAHRGAIFRQAVLCAYEGSEAIEHEAKIVKSISNKISKILTPLLFTSENLQSFMIELQRFLQEAVQLWKIIQRCIQQGDVDGTPNVGWNADKDYDQKASFSTGQEISAAHSFPILSMFPRMVVGDITIHPGCAVWSGQSMVVAANSEFFQPKPHGREFGGREERREKRRLSSTNSSTVDEGLPASPTSSMSYSNRIHNRNLETQTQPEEEASKSQAGSKDGS